MLSIAVEPVESPVIVIKPVMEKRFNPAHTKYKVLEAGFQPKNLNVDILDEVLLVSSDESFDMARELSLTEGVLGGISTGATVTAALRAAKGPENGRKNTVVARCELWRERSFHSFKAAKAACRNDERSCRRRLISSFLSGEVGPRCREGSFTLQ